jgi:hypothetical protein
MEVMRKTPQIKFHDTFYMHSTKARSQDSTVSIATGYRLDDLGVRHQVLVGSRIFLPPHHPDQLWGPTQHPIYWIWGGGFFSWGKVARA